MDGVNVLTDPTAVSPGTVGLAMISLQSMQDYKR